MQSWNIEKISNVRAKAEDDENTRWKASKLLNQGERLASLKSVCWEDLFYASDITFYSPCFRD